MQDILQREAQKPGWIDIPNGALSVRVVLAQALRQAGQFQQAIDQLTDVLKQKESSLELQIAAAEAYQTWGDSGAAGNYELALNGTVPNGKGGNVVCGLERHLQDIAKRHGQGSETESHLSRLALQRLAGLLQTRDGRCDQER